MAQRSRVEFREGYSGLRPTQKRALEEKPSGARIAKKTRKPSRAKKCSRDGLVAEACRDRDLVAALGAAAAQHGGAGLGGHAAQKAVDLAPAAAIRLKGALRHRRILFSIFGIVASLPA